MRILWTLFKVIFGLALAAAAGVLALALAAGAIGTLLGLTILLVRLACIGFVGYGLYRLARFILAPAARPSARPAREIPSVDPYYDAAMRELETHMGDRTRV